MFLELLIDLHINMSAQKYNVSEKMMHCIIREESNYSITSENPRSSATGLAQFISGTWKAWRQEMGKNPDLDLRKEIKPSVETLAYGLSKGRHNHWVTYNHTCKYLIK